MRDDCLAQTVAAASMIEQASDPPPRNSARKGQASAVSLRVVSVRSASASRLASLPSRPSTGTRERLARRGVDRHQRVGGGPCAVIGVRVAVRRVTRVSRVVGVARRLDRQSSQ